MTNTPTTPPADDVAKIKAALEFAGAEFSIVADGLAALGRLSQPVMDAEEDPLLRTQLAQLIGYARWQIGYGKDYHPTLLSAVVSAEAALSTPPAQQPESNAGDVMAVLLMVDAWGNGLRHRTAHEDKMVKAARAILGREAP